MHSAKVVILYILYKMDLLRAIGKIYQKIEIQKIGKIWKPRRVDTRSTMFNKFLQFAQCTYVRTKKTVMSDYITVYLFLLFMPQ